MGNIALLIIAIAFAVLVVFLVIVLHKVSKVVEEANRTVKLVSSDVDVLLHQADGIMLKPIPCLMMLMGKSPRLTLCLQRLLTCLKVFQISMLQVVNL